jgi:EmrB/QacA subfamily drug resistance transporter
VHAHGSSHGSIVEAVKPNPANATLRIRFAGVASKTAGAALPDKSTPTISPSGTDAATVAGGGKKETHPNLILAICCMSLLVVGMDVTIVNVALPAIQRDLRATVSGLQWILDAYTLVVASLLMLAGSVSDRVGRRRVFQFGLLLFTAGSLLCSLAHSIGQLIAFRALQGLGASMLNPVALSIIANAFPEPKARARAVGVWGAVAGASLALGPLIGGALTQSVGWRSIFWINLPICLTAVVLAARFVPESKALHARAFDPVGQLLVFLGLASLTYAVIEGPHAGWQSSLILGLFVTSGASLALFLFYEPRRKQPLLDLRFFHSVPFSSATLLAVCAFASFAGFLFLNALYLQQVRGLSPFHTGLCTLPLAIAMMVSAPLSGRLVAHHGPRPSLLAAGAGFLLSTWMLTRLTVSTPMALIMLAYVLFGVGLGMVNPAITNNAVAGMPLSQAGVAAAIASTGRQVGAALGVAVAGTVVSASHTKGSDFTQATHPIWWIMTGCSAIVLLLGWASTTPWAHASTERVAFLLDHSSR